MKKTTIWEYSELRWSIDEITYPEQAKKAKRLMRLVKSGNPFDIGWVGLKKEIVSFNIRRERKNGKVELSVCASMDELPYDLMTDVNETLTYEQIDEIMSDDEYCFRLDEVNTDITETEMVKSSVSLEEIANALMRLWATANKELDEGVNIVKSVISDYLAKNDER